MGPAGGSVMSNESMETDLAADIDKELGFGSYRIPDLPFGSSSSFSSTISTRKRLFPSDSPIPLSLESSFGSDQPTPKHLRPLFTPEKIPAFQRAELLLSGKKEIPPPIESGEVVELRKEVTKQKQAISEYQTTVCTFSLLFFIQFLSFYRSPRYKAPWTKRMRKSKRCSWLSSKYRWTTLPSAKSLRGWWPWPNPTMPNWKRRKPALKNYR